MKKNKELEEIVIKASKDFKTKDDLLEKFKAKADQFEKQYLELKSETDTRIDELEADMEKYLLEK